MSGTHSLLHGFSSFFAGLLVLAGASRPLNAEIVNWISTEPEWTVTNGIILETGNDIGPQTTLVDVSSKLNMKEFSAFLGLQVQSSQTDMTTVAVYAPTFFNHFNFGSKTIVHIQHCPDIFFEADYLCGIYSRYATKRFFCVEGNFFYHAKAARIFAIEDSVPWLTNDTIAFELNMDFAPTERLSFSFDIASFSQYRYMLFLAPDFRLGGEYKLSDLISLGSLLEIQYIDMFTLSSNLNTVDFRFYAKLEF